MNSDDSIVKIYACNNATKISSKNMNSANAIDTGITTYVCKIKIKAVILSSNQTPHSSSFRQLE